MNKNEQSLQRLLAAARKAQPAPADESAPYGFSTRVAALAFAQGGRPSAFARLSLRAALVAGALAVAAVAINFSAIKSAFESDNAAATDDPIAEVLNLGT